MKGGVRKRLIDLLKNAMVCEAGMRDHMHIALWHMTTGTVIGGIFVPSNLQRGAATFFCVARHAFFVEVSRGFFDKKCMACHTEKSCSAMHFLLKYPEASSCEGSKWGS